MGAIETAISEGVSLLRDFIRAFSLERIRARRRAWTVDEWVSPYHAMFDFGSADWAKELYDAEEKATWLRLTPVPPDDRDAQRKRDAEYVTTDITISNLKGWLSRQIAGKLRDGELVARGFRAPMRHGASYVAIQSPEWEILQLDISKNEASGGGITYLGVTIGKVGQRPIFRITRPRHRS